MFLIFLLQYSSKYLTSLVFKWYFFVQMSMVQYLNGGLKTGLKKACFRFQEPRVRMVRQVKWLSHLTSFPCSLLSGIQVFSILQYIFSWVFLSVQNKNSIHNGTNKLWYILMSPVSSIFHLTSTQPPPKENPISILDAEIEPTLV